jgi:hypothetical protein
MKMAEEVQTGTPADGFGRVLWVPTIADLDAPTVAELTAGTVIALTYGLSPDGFRHETSIATITTGRYTLAQALELDGVETDTIELQYVYNRETPTDAETALVKGAVGNIVHQLGYANDTDIAAGQILNAVAPVKISTPRDVPPTQNTELMKVVKANVTGKVRREVEVAAGA